MKERQETDGEYTLQEVADNDDLKFYTALKNGIVIAGPTIWVELVGDLRLREGIPIEVRKADHERIMALAKILFK